MLDDHCRKGPAASWSHWNSAHRSTRALWPVAAATAAVTITMDDLGAHRTDAEVAEVAGRRSQSAQPLADNGSVVDVADFRNFYRNFVPALVAFLMWQGASLVEAADVAQKTMIEAFRRWSQIDQPELWARTVASRTLMRRATATEQGCRAGLPIHSMLLPASVDAKAWEHRHAILGVLSGLSSPQRQVIAWAMEGYSSAEIANELNIGFGAVRTHLTKGRGMLAADRGPSMSSVDAADQGGLDLWLACQQHKLVIDLIGTVEIQAALREVENLVNNPPTSPPSSAPESQSS